MTDPQQPPNLAWNDPRQQQPGADSALPSYPYADQDPTAHTVQQEQAGRAPRKVSFWRTLLAALVWAAVNVIAALVITGGPPSSRAAGAFIGQLIVPTLVAALVAWLIARSASRIWRFWQLVLLTLPFYLVVRLLLVAGAMGAAS